MPEAASSRPALTEADWTQAGRAAYPAAAAELARRFAAAEPLPEPEREALRPAFGLLVDQVRLHRRSELPAEWAQRGGSARPAVVPLCGEEGLAQAYGPDVYLSAAAEELGPRERLALLAHQLAHVRQFQEAGGSLEAHGERLFAQYARGSGDPADSALERAAARAVTAALTPAYHALLSRCTQQPDCRTQAVKEAFRFCLGRQPESPETLRRWSERVEKAGFEAMLAEACDTPEAARHRDSRVKEAFRFCLNRAPRDAAEQEEAAKQMRQAGFDALRDSLCNLPEASEGRMQTVAGLYRSCLNREPEDERLLGLWAEHLRKIGREAFEADFCSFGPTAVRSATD